MNFFGRKIILTKLDPVPRLLRASPGYFVLNEREIEQLKCGDAATFKELASIAFAENSVDALRGVRRR